MSNFRKFISMSAVAILGATNLLTSLTYAQATAKPYDSLTGADLEKPALRFIMPNKDVYLYAITEANTYTVTYSGTTKTSWTMTGKVFTYDTTWTLTPNAYAKTWYTFSWWKNASGTNYPDKADVFNWTTQDGVEIPIYAQWNANKYNLAYDLNKGSSTSDPAHGASHPNEATYDQDFTVNNPSMVWYTFSWWTITNMDSEAHIVGWQASNATSATGVKGTEFKNLRATSGDVNFKAIWSKNLHTPYTVEHYLENLTGWYPTDPVKTDNLSGTTDTTVTPSVHVYTWFTPDANTPTSGNIDADGNKVFTYRYTRDSNNLTITAGRWVASVKWVGTVNTTGATTNSSTQISFKYDEPVTLSFTLKSWYTGWTWSWYEDEYATFNMPAFSTGKTAYATPITYNITYNTRSGTVSPANPTTYTVESSGITLNNPTRIYSKFAWWTGWVIGGTQLAGPTMTVTIPTWSTWNRSYTATWTCLSWFYLSSDAKECRPNKDTEYTVRHFYQNLSWNYSVVPVEVTQTWETLDNTDARPIVLSWFEVDGDIVNVPITWDGSTVVDIRYKRLSYTWTIASVTGITGAKADGEYSDWQYKYDDEVTLSADTLSWYTFDHWEVEDANGNTVPVTNSGDIDEATFNMPASSVTITPKVTRDDYTITMILHNGTGTYPSEYTVESADIPLADPTRDTGSVFEGWSWTDITSAPKKPVTIAHWSVGNRTYEAIWSCRAWYHEVGDSCVANQYSGSVDYADGESHWAAEVIEFTYDQVTTLDNPEQSWYIFSWWIVTWMSGWVEHVLGTITTTWDSAAVNSGATTFMNLSTEQWFTDIKFKADWTPRDDTDYVVYHYVKNVGSNTYTLSGTDNLEGTTDSTLTLANLKKTFTGFDYSAWYLTGGTTRPTSWAVATTTIDKYGRTAIYLYYDRNMWNVYLSGDAHVDTLSGAGQYEYGATVNVSATAKTWYHFVKWEKRKSNWSKE